MRKITVAAVVLALGAGAAGAQEAQQPQQSQPSAPPSQDSRALLGKDTAKFFEDVAATNMTAARRSQIAAQNASNPAVKQFAQKAQQESVEANSELKELAQRKNVPLPTEPHADQQEQLAELKDKQGEEFDKAYVEQTVERQNDQLELYEKAAKDSTDPEVREYAARTLPELRAQKLAGETLQKQTTRSDRPSWWPWG